MYLGYLLAPAVAWLVAGSLKFAINSVSARRPAWGQIGYGGLPSTHITIVSTAAWLVGFRAGWDHPAFGVAAALVVVVMLDAVSLRRYVGQHAVAINVLNGRPGTLRERVGHKPHEVAAGLLVGLGCAVALWKLL